MIFFLYWRKMEIRGTGRESQTLLYNTHPTWKEQNKLESYFNRHTVLQNLSLMYVYIYIPLKTTRLNFLAEYLQYRNIPPRPSLPFPLCYGYDIGIYPIFFLPIKKKNQPEWKKNLPPPPPQTKPNQSNPIQAPPNHIPK